MGTADGGTHDTSGALAASVIRSEGDTTQLAGGAVVDGVPVKVYWVAA